MKFSLLFILLLVVLYTVQGVLIDPRLDRNWATDQKQLASIKITDDLLTIKHIRDISYKTAEVFELSFYEKTFRLEELKAAWYVIEPFGQIGAAHTFVSFEFEDGSVIAISVEIRREQGETFNVLKGLFRQYELAYVIASEADLIKLRAEQRNHEIRLYPIKANKKLVQSVFMDMLKRAQTLETTPEFYNTITNNCTTNIIKHVRKFSEKDIPWWDIRYLLPEHSDRIAFNAGILDSALPLEEARQFFSITEKAKQCPKKGFSGCIRATLY